MIQNPLIKVGIIVSILIVFSFAYYAIRGRLIYAATSFLIGITTYFLIFVLSKNEFGLSAGLGLFAIFGIIRYRTEQVPILEMTYIFLSITIAVISALSDDIVNSFSTIIFINLFLVVISTALFAFINKNEEDKINILVDGIEWLSLPSDEQIEYLSKKSFHPIIRFELLSIDWLKETSVINVTIKKK